MDTKVTSHFYQVDPVISGLLSRIGESRIKLTSRAPGQYFPSLCSDIISQQLSNRVADVFWKRFVALFSGRRISPGNLLKLPDSALRSIGISNSKVAYLRSLTDHFLDRKIDFQNISDLSDEYVIGELTKIHGVGRWTAEMFCIFSLGRSDIFSAGDRGLKNAINKFYPVPPDPVVWSPYRSYACLILWKSLEL